MSSHYVKKGAVLLVKIDGETKLLYEAPSNGYLVVTYTPEDEARGR